MIWLLINIVTSIKPFRSSGGEVTCREITCRHFNVNNWAFMKCFSENIFSSMHFIIPLWLPDEQVSVSRIKIDCSWHKQHEKQNVIDLRQCGLSEFHYRIWIHLKRKIHFTSFLPLHFYMTGYVNYLNNLEVKSPINLRH